jgi:hypothetical protein
VSKPAYIKQSALGAGVCLAICLSASNGPALAASPEYCAVYAHASSDPEGAASASAEDTDALKRAYDKAYFECLNLDDEPKLPADVAMRGSDSSDLGEGDISDGDEKPVIKKARSTPAKKVARAATPRRKKQQWHSGYDAGTPEWVKWCTAKYNSFDPKTGQYKSYSGTMKACK